MQCTIDAQLTINSENAKSYNLRNLCATQLDGSRSTSLLFLHLFYAIRYHRRVFLPCIILPPTFGGIALPILLHGSTGCLEDSQHGLYCLTILRLVRIFKTISRSDWSIKPTLEPLMMSSIHGGKRRSLECNIFSLGQAP